MAKCQVEECTDPECEGNPYQAKDKPIPFSYAPRAYGAWDKGHRSAAEHSQVLMRALTYGAIEAVEGKPLTHGGGEGWRINLARQELAEEAKDA